MLCDNECVILYHMMYGITSALLVTYEYPLSQLPPISALTMKITRNLLEDGYLCYVIATLVSHCMTYVV